MADLIVRKAEKGDFERVMDFYRSMTVRMKEKGFVITWVKDVHPSPAFVKEAIEEGSLYMGLLEGRVVSAMVLNHSHAPQYDKVRWALDLKDRDFFVIHALGVDPDVAGKGIGSGMIREAVRSAREKGAGALRLDVLNTNEPAEKLYLRNGFQYRGEAELFYENTGRRIFRMYELVL